MKRIYSPLVLIPGLAACGELPDNAPRLRDDMREITFRAPDSRANARPGEPFPEQQRGEP